MSNWLTYALKLVRAASFWILDGIAVLGLATKETAAVVFVRVDAIGDFVLWFSCIPLIRDHFRGAPSILICNRTVAELARCCAGFDQVIVVDVDAFRRNVAYRWKLLRSVRRLGAAVAVQPTFSRVFLTGDAIVRATGAAKRVGSVGELANLKRWQHWVANRSYSHLIPAAQEPLMELERNCEFLHGLGINSAKAEVARLPRIAELSGILKLPRDYFVIFPGAGQTERMWPAEKFAETARTVARSYGWQMVVCGSASEAELADAVIEHSALADTVNLAGKTSLPEFVEIVRGARLLIGNDTSALHISAAVETPSVCVMGGGHFGRFLPYSSSATGTNPLPVFQPMECFGCNWHCVKRYKKGSSVPCISVIGVATVLHAVRRAVGPAKRSGSGAEPFILT